MSLLQPLPEHTPLPQSFLSTPRVPDTVLGAGNKGAMEQRNTCSDGACILAGWGVGDKAPPPPPPLHGANMDRYRKRTPTLVSQRYYMHIPVTCFQYLMKENDAVILPT